MNKRYSRVGVDTKQISLVVFPPTYFADFLNFWDEMRKAGYNV